MAVKRLKVNLQGQSLGRKGLETRSRMIEAAGRLLKEQPAVELTAVSVAKAAQTSSAAFYLYFQDVKDLLYALSEIAEADMVVVHSILDEPWNPNNIETEHAHRVVEAFESVWDTHREVLRLRNLEADRGVERFERIRLRTSLRVINRFADHIMLAYRSTPAYTRNDALAEASVLVAAMERLFASDPALMKKGFGIEAVSSALTRVVALTLAVHSTAQVSDQRSRSAGLAGSQPRKMPARRQGG